VAAAAGVVVADLVITAPVDVVVTSAVDGNLVYFFVIDVVLGLDSKSNLCVVHIFFAAIVAVDAVDTGALDVEVFFGVTDVMVALIVK
jgi:hypothetical protein